MATKTPYAGRAFGELLTSVRHDIEGGELAASDMLPSEKVLAQEYGISRWAVREAMDRLAGEGLIDRIPGKGTVVVGRNATDRSTRPVRLLVAIDSTRDLGRNAYALELVQDLRLGNTRLPQPFSLSYQFIDFSVGLGVLDAMEADAVVVLPFSERCQHLLEEHAPSRLSLPLICVGRELATDVIPQIYVDHQLGAARATKYLLSIGHERLWLIAPPSYPGGYSDVRQKAFGKTMLAAGSDAELALISKASLDYTDIQQLVAEHLSRADPPTALFVGDGNLASPVLHALAVLNKQVPEDISVLTYDDYATFRSFAPPLTAVRQPLAETADRTLEILDAQLRRKQTAPIRTAIAPELLVRESCAARLSKKNRPPTGPSNDRRRETINVTRGPGL